MFVTPLAGAPTANFRRATYEGRTYKHFSSAEAKTSEVLGEFPWRVLRGDAVTATDYIAPPYMLSSEESPGEKTWSRGVYVPRHEVVEAFGPPTRKLLGQKGIHPCQPNPDKEVLRWLRKVFVGALIGWLAMTMWYRTTCQNKVVFDGVVSKEAPAKFELDSPYHLATLEIKSTTQLKNQWCWYKLLLVEQDTEQALHAAIGASFYPGSRGSSNEAELLMGNVPNGNYVLQVTPEAGQLTQKWNKKPNPYTGPLELTITRDVPLWRWPILSLLTILVIPAFVVLRYRIFEAKRWSESDHA